LASDNAFMQYRSLWGGVLDMAETLEGFAQRLRELRKSKNLSSIQLYSSTALLEELATTWPPATKRLALIGRSAREVLADYVEAIELVKPASVPRVVLGDVDDDQVIAAAVAARADLIDSGDRNTCWRWAVIRASTSSMRLRRSGAHRFFAGVP
jgi:predicted nucleic acid-binding protein